MVTLASFWTSGWRRTLLLCAFLLGVAWTSVAQAQSTEEQDWMPAEYAALQQTLDARSDDILSIATLFDLQRLTRWMRADQAEEALTQARDALTHPLARAWADYQLLRFYLESGNVDKLRAQEDALGFVDRWMLVGPFRNDGMDGFDAVYDPELEGYQGPEQSFTGKFNDLKWAEVAAASETGYIAAHERIGDASTAVIYASTECYFERSSDSVQLAVDGAYKLWVDGAPVARQDEQLGGVMFRDFAPLRARRGWHRVMLKVATDREEPGWHMRIVDADGRSVVRECRPVEDADGPVTQDDFPALETLNDKLRALQDDTWTDEDRVDAAYLLRTFHRNDPSEPWQSFLDGVEDAKLSSTHRVRAARAEHTHWRKRRRLDALDLAAATVSDALYYLSVRRADVGLQARKDGVRGIRELQKRFADDPRVQSQWLAYLGQEAGKVSVSDALVDVFMRYGARPALCEEVLRHRVRRDEQSEEIYDRCAQRRLGGIGAIERYVEYLAIGGDWTRVEEALERLEPLWSGRVDWFGVLQTVAGFRGDESAVRRAIEHEIAQRPQDAYPYVKHAESLIRDGRMDEAAASLRTAIDLQPQRQSARDLLSLIEAQSDAFYEKWRVDDDALRALAKTLDLEDHALGRVVAQEVSNVYRGGLSSTFYQEAFRVQTREGVEKVRHKYLYFVPGQSDSQVVSVRVLKPDGTRHDNYERRDVRPYAGAQAMYSDYHERRLTVSNVQPGDLVVYEYVIHETAQTNMFDDYFDAVSEIDSFMPTALYRYVVQAPSDRALFIRRSGEDIALEEHEKDGRIERVYEERDLAPIPKEYRMPGASDVKRYLQVSTYSDVNRMANWYWNLIKDQLTTSPEMIATVESLIDGVEDRRDQVAHIYDYVVRHTRYVHLGFGLAGWQPYRTTRCFDQRYGDCKDTASLLKVMLGIAGIDAHVVLIRTADLGRLNNPLPTLGGYNHAIAYVPEFDLYLDGTTSYFSSHDLPSVDQGATALIIEDGAGGRFVETPYRPAASEREELTFSIDARTPSEAKGRLHWVLQGEMGAAVRRHFENADQQRKTLERWFGEDISDLVIEDATFEGISDWMVPFEAQATLHKGRWLRARGDEYSLLPFGRETFDLTGLTSTSSRVHPLHLNMPERTVQELEIRLPDDLEPLSLPSEEQVVESPDFGRFVMRVTWDADAHRLRVYGELQRDIAVVSPEDYAAYRSWTRDIYRRANRTIRWQDARKNDEAKP